ncbi:helix-turn-helix, psq domain-containing protein [Hirsutella rhossiliensis]
MTLKRPRSIYTEDIMANAIIDVTKNGLSQYRAAQKYDIPQQSISDRLKGQVALADQIQPRQLLKNTVNVDEGGIMSGFGLDSLVGKELQKQWFLTEFGKIADWHYITSPNGWTDNHIAIEWLERMDMEVMQRMHGWPHAF